MLDIIQLLPDAIANQIAAGEVVQRPASVVKELLENAVDAKSSKVSVKIKEAGKILIQITDNGNGMSGTDARMSFERHATSKIRKSEDLFSIRTMGFRGEALASIAAVAQVEMRTKRKEDEIGTCLVIEGSEVKKQEPVACPDGTSISIKNLFFNVPARRSFLKSNPVETRHIIDEFQRVALSHPEISFSLYQNDMEVYNLATGKLSQRIVGLFGKQYQEQLIPCQEETAHINIKGYIGKPEHAKKTKGEQFFFVNNRYIRNNYLNHAVLNAFEGLLPDESYPFYVLFIEIDPVHIDINVHPTKTEIKFDDERTVYAIVRAAVKQALGAHNITPSLDFDQDVNFQAITSSGLNFNNASQADKDRTDRNYRQFKTTSREQANVEHWERMFEISQKEITDYSGAEIPSFDKPEAVTFDSAANQMPTQKELYERENQQGNNNFFQIHYQYIASQIKSGLMLIDQQAAHERILYEKYSTALEKKSGASQQLLFPQTITLNPADFALVMELAPEFRALGFVFNIFGKTDIIINGIPADIAGNDGKDLFEGLVEQFKKNQAELSIGKGENMARSMAKRTAIKPGQQLSNTEMRTIIDQLFACSNPNYSPHGQVIFYILSLEKIADFFHK